MSRVGKNPVEVPSGVEVNVKGSVISAKGKLGELSFAFPASVSVAVEDGKVVVTPADNSKQARAMWGTARARIANLVEGVSKGFEKRLELVGVGYRAQMKGTDLNLQLGYSHDVLFKVPSDIKAAIDGPTNIILTGADKQKVGQVAAEIRKWRSPEPYKGKGIRYQGEYIMMKEGKKK
jgi:large subunit ribosomal protein L6